MMRSFFSIFILVVLSVPLRKKEDYVYSSSGGIRRYLLHFSSS